MSHEERVDCVIVGGGIGGAVLALLLGRHGHRVAVLERERQAPAIARPEILARSTVQIFDQLGLGERMRQDAILPLEGLALYQEGGGPVVELSREDFDRAGVQPYSTDPGRTRQVLLEAAAATASVSVHRGVEVEALLRDGERLVGVRARDGATWPARLIVGDDGGRSRVREALGIPLRTQEFPLDFVTAAGPALPGMAPSAGQGWISPRRVRNGMFAGLFLPLPGGRAAVVFIMTSKTFQRYVAAPETFYREAARLSPRCESLARSYAFPQGFAHVRRPYGHAPRYVGDGAALMGDAAHPVTPAGGQGANMSIADAVALAEVAHNALTAGDCSAMALAAYEAERRSANQRSVQISVAAGRVLRTLLVCPWLSPVLLMFLRRVNEAQNRQQLLRGVAQAFVSRSGT